MSYEAFKLVRLTAKIFTPGEYELGRYAAAGLGHIAQVDDWEPEAIAAKVAEADIVIVVGTPMPRVVVDAMVRARAIARMGTGTDKIDVARATELGILVANTPFFCIEEMADHVMAMILSLNRQLPAMQHAMLDGDLMRARRRVATIPRMSSCTLGLVGFGRSAVLTARRAKGFGMRVLATRQNKNAPRTEADALGVEMTDLDTVLRESDYISLHVPLTQATYHMIDDAALRKMKPTACIINTSRGALIDEPALIAALDEGRLAGAGIDTYGLMNIFVEWIEPPVHPLSGRDNVILSPHAAGGSIQAKFDMFDAGVQNLIDILEDRWPLAENIVNPTVIPRYPLAERTSLAVQS
jgi:D-3-phosphoglycerate dehydrogenase